MLRATLPLALLLSTSAAAQDVDYAKDVHPILAERCFECHGPKKHKGDFRFDTREGLFGEAAGAIAVLPGDSENSLMLEMVTLPADDPDIMPPKGEPLTAAQVDVLRRWIDQGAPWEPVALAEAEPDPLAFPELAPEEAAAREAALAALRERGLEPLQIAAGHHALDLNASLLRGAVGDADLELLTGLAPSLAWLNLSGTAVTDAGLAHLAHLPRLQRLNLSRTQVTDGGLRHLVGLTELRYLNLYGTPVGDAGVPILARLPKLAKLFLWGSQVTEAGVSALREANPELYVNDGATPPPAPVESAPINTTCPVSGEAVDAAVTSQFLGQTVAFCCEKCKAAFDGDPRKFADKLPGGEESKGPANTKCPISGSDVDAAFTVSFEGKTVGFCCGKCKAAYEADPAKFADQVKAVLGG